MTCARLVSRRRGAAPVLDAARRSRIFGAVLAVGSLFASGCGGTSAAPACSVVLASAYDQSCTVDTDCVAVGQVPACPALACDLNCTMWTIAKSAAPQYMTALSRASAGVVGAPCGCVAYNPDPCCRGGMCTTTCGSPTDTLPACSDAGGSCSYPAGAGCMGGGKAGPADACAYSDETCCVN